MEQIMGFNQAGKICRLIFGSDFIPSQVLNLIDIVTQGLEQKALVHIWLHKVPGPTFAHYITFCQGQCLLPFVKANAFCQGLSCYVIA